MRTVKVSGARTTGDRSSSSMAGMSAGEDVKAERAGGESILAAFRMIQNNGVDSVLCRGLKALNRPLLRALLAGVAGRARRPSLLNSGFAFLLLFHWCGDNGGR